MFDFKMCILNAYLLLCHLGKIVATLLKLKDESLFSVVYNRPKMSCGSEGMSFPFQLFLCSVFYTQTQIPWFIDGNLTFVDTLMFVLVDTLILITTKRLHLLMMKFELNLQGDSIFTSDFTYIVIYAYANFLSK